MRDCKVMTEQSSGCKLSVCLNYVQADRCDVKDVSHVGAEAAVQKTADVGNRTDTVSQNYVECALWSPAPQPEHTAWLPTNAKGVKLKVSPLKNINAIINGNQHRAMIDSGA